MLAHYRTVARGGAGTLVTEALRVHRSDGRRDSAIWMHEPDVVPSLRRLAAAVHAEGALLIAQLNHGGRQHFSRRVPTLWAPSAIACPRRSVVGFKLIKARQQRDLAFLILGVGSPALHAGNVLAITCGPSGAWPC